MGDLFYIQKPLRDQSDTKASDNSDSGMLSGKTKWVSEYFTIDRSLPTSRVQVLLKCIYSIKLDRILQLNQLKRDGVHLVVHIVRNDASG